MIFSASEDQIQANPDTKDNIKVLVYAEPLVLECNETNPSDDLIFLW